MNQYMVYRRDYGKDDGHFCHIATLNGIKSVRESFGSIFYSKNAKVWRQIDRENKIEYIFKKVLTNDVCYVTIGKSEGIMK